LAIVRPKIVFKVYFALILLRIVMHLTTVRPKIVFKGQL
jgi:hypothetical protein